MNTNSSATESGSTLKNYTFGDSSMQVVVSDNGEPLFIANNICEILGIQNSRQAVSQLDDDEKLTYVLDTSGQRREVNVVTESGLYSLILRSNKPEAKTFKRFVTHEVLPAIRKHGVYATQDKIEEMLTDPDVMIQALTQLKNERLLRQQAEQRAQLASEQLQITETVVKQQAPKVQYYDRVMQSTDVFAIDVIASDLGLTAVKLNRFLAERGVQYKQQGCWVLTAKYRNQGLTRTKTHTFDRSNGEKGSSQHMYWTEKGKELIYKLYSTATNAKSIK